jgi:CheY-like chemotaxis protein
MNVMQSTSPSQRSVILAVDDDEDDIDLMKLLFRKAGVEHPIEVYRRGEDLMDALSDILKKSANAFLPLLCFLDIKMPQISGLEVLRWIREQQPLDTIAVVMLSSSEHPEDIKQAAGLGAQCYLSKYPQPAVLKRVIEEAEQMLSRHNGMAKEWFGLSANLLLRWGLNGKTVKHAVT